MMRHLILLDGEKAINILTFRNLEPSLLLTGDLHLIVSSIHIPTNVEGSGP